jgi:hypothetical protein
MLPPRNRRARVAGMPKARGVASIYLPWRKAPAEKAVVHEPIKSGEGPLCGLRLSEMSRWAPVARPVTCKRCLRRRAALGLGKDRA